MKTYGPFVTLNTAPLHIKPVNPGEKPGHLGTIWSSVALDTSRLGEGAARARRQMNRKRKP